MYDDTTLWKLVDGELAPAEAEAVEAAAEKDPTLRRRIAQLRAMKRGVLDGAPTPPDGFARRVAAQAIARGPAPVLDLADARRFVRRVAVAAAIVGALGLAYLVADVVPSLFPSRQIEASPDPLLPGGR
jgi:anti-sigma factor RsiW